MVFFKFIIRRSFSSLSEYENEIPFTKPAPIDEIESKKQQKK